MKPMCLTDLPSEMPAVALDDSTQDLSDDGTPPANTLPHSSRLDFPNQVDTGKTARHSSSSTESQKKEGPQTKVAKQENSDVDQQDNWESSEQRSLPDQVEPRHRPLHIKNSKKVPPAPQLPSVPPRPVPPVTFSAPTQPPFQPPELHIKRMGIIEFEGAVGNAIIEVLLGEPRISMPSEAKSDASGEVTSDHMSGLQVQPTLRPNPTKIRIRSDDVLFELEDIAKRSGRGFKATDGQKYMRHFAKVFIYPFKLFSHMELDIRARFAELESYLKGEDPDAANPSDLVDQEKTTEPKDGAIKSSSTNSKKKVLQGLKLLIEVFDSDLKPMFDMRRKIRKGSLTSIWFPDLWHLFDFGEDVKTAETEPRIYRVLRWTGGRPDLSPRSNSSANLPTEHLSLKFYVDCACLDFDGRLFAPIQRTFIIPRYDGERRITSLPIFPLVLDPDHRKLRKELFTRGDKWLQLARPNVSLHKHYTGRTLDEPHAEEVDSQVIIDNKTAIMYYYTTALSSGVSSLTAHIAGELYGVYPIDSPNQTSITLRHYPPPPPGVMTHDGVHQDYELDLQYESAFFGKHKTWLAATETPEEIEDEDKILLPPHVHGFILRSRKWARLNVDLIEPVSYTSGFDALVLPDGHKDTVRALVANRAIPTTRDKDPLTERSMDLVRGKGDGLVILLHGAPGVGKTSTAECVADNTQRPLFPITCGDIGDTAAEVEKNLGKNFLLAHKWGCVLLLDEADIFLQKRDKTDIKRNAIVSVFLRTLEYYRGILFLTTNRVGTFDPAFRSRIHVSLYYPPLKKDATMQIWKMHLARTRELKEKDFKINKKEIIKFAKEHYHELKKAGAGSWNGRQIRNAFQTAIALAEYRAMEKNKQEGNTSTIPELNKEHFVTVAQASRDFDLYLKRTHNDQTEADLARHEQLRNDDFYSSDHRSSRHNASRRKRMAGKKKKGALESEDSELSKASDSEASVEGFSESGDESGQSESKGEEDEPPKRARRKQR